MGGFCMQPEMRWNVTTAIANDKRDYLGLSGYKPEDQPCSESNLLSAFNGSQHLAAMSACVAGHQLMQSYMPDYFQACKLPAQ